MDSLPLQSQHLDELLGSLPACCRCRLNRRRCDTQLPSCHNCSKAGAECIFFDHVLQRNQPRSHVSELLSRLQENQCETAACRGNQESSISNSASPVSLPAGSRLDLQTSRYIGNISCLSRPLSAVNVTTAETATTLAPPTLDIEEKLSSDISQDVHNYLVTTYVNNIHPLYPFLDESLPFLSPCWLINRDLHSLDARQLFTLGLVHSIASHHILDNMETDQQRRSYRTLADECHARASILFDKAATDISVPTLQTVILAALHSLFSPQQGNCGQLIGLAVRLAIELSASDKQRSRSDESKMQQIYRTIYCIENQVATALDRPALLPEPTRTQGTDADSTQNALCDLYRIQSRFRSNPDDEDGVASLSQELSSHIKNLEEKPIEHGKVNALATAYETRLLLSNDEEAAARLLEIFARRDYVRTFLSPQWAYRAGVTIVSATSWKGSGSVQAYGRCLVFLEQCSRRWPSAGALKQSLEAFALKTVMSQ